MGCSDFELVTILILLLTNSPGPYRLFSDFNGVWLINVPIVVIQSVKR
ncbi:hypothetical protein SAMN04488066_106116 [Halorubrum aquaticum]|uniref:Uncharacterized protein n=1 Tax=Halorubrum aquaticum TaxID=387340 RepID=A0A1I3ALS2_9EURY|nr:hypothetical protein SAMN04488066_106116 [Halorubrum aquaticum]